MKPITVAGTEKKNVCTSNRTTRLLFWKPSVLSMANSYVRSSTSINIIEYITIASMMNMKKIIVYKILGSWKYRNTASLRLLTTGAYSFMPMS